MVSTGHRPGHTASLIGQMGARRSFSTGCLLVDSDGDIVMTVWVDRRGGGGI